MLSFQRRFGLILSKNVAASLLGHTVVAVYNSALKDIGDQPAL